MRIHVWQLFILFVVAWLSASAQAQLVQEFKPPQANCCLQFTGQSLADQLKDWNQLGRYHEDTVRLQKRL
jgi:hypothetical protein